MTSIAGHNLTLAEMRVLGTVTNYLIQHGEDSFLTSSTSPRGDGREIPVYEIFPERNNVDNANRRTMRRLYKLGVLRACEIQYTDRLTVKAVPLETLVKPAPGCAEGDGGKGL